MTGRAKRKQRMQPERERASRHSLDRLVRRLRDDAHHDEAEALPLVDLLMQEYATTSDPLTDDAETFGEDLRTLARGWSSPNAEAERSAGKPTSASE